MTETTMRHAITEGLAEKEFTSLTFIVHSTHSYRELLQKFEEFRIALLRHRGLCMSRSVYLFVSIQYIYIYVFYVLARLYNPTAGSNNPNHFAKCKQELGNKTGSRKWGPVQEVVPGTKARCWAQRKSELEQE